jgi:hypothetical protein
VLASAGGALAACTVAVGTPGVMRLSADGLSLSSETGVASVMTITDISLFGSQITVSNPRLDGGPNLPGATVEASYAATWLLGVGQASGGFSSSSRSFSVPGVANLVVTLTLDSRVVSAAGFRQGTYTARTSVDCS